MSLYRIRKTFEISAAHHLKLSYESKCENLHGHNWTVTVECTAGGLNENGMVVDFNHFKQTIIDKLDHNNLNEVMECNPTAENIARWIGERIPNCRMVTVQESEGNIASYEVGE